MPSTLANSLTHRMSSWAREHNPLTRFRGGWLAAPPLLLLLHESAIQNFFPVQ
ncbi:hypothetical protein Mapa_000528 [Marchantia paleacea]|nr:hypothetical protein Mapa_000528 [Marchantia paleacea]